MQKYNKIELNNIPLMFFSEVQYSLPQHLFDKKNNIINCFCHHMITTYLVVWLPLKR